MIVMQTLKKRFNKSIFVPQKAEPSVEIKVQNVPK